MEVTSTKRIEYIDALRGIAMMLVIYFHIPSYCLGNAYIGFNDILEWVRMPLFFFISGFVFYKADRIWDSETIRKVLKNKFMVQIVPMAVFMTLFLLMFGYMEPSSFGSDKKGYWYTFVLFEYFVLYIGAEALFNKKRTLKGEAYVFLSVLVISLASFYYAKFYIRYSEELGNWKTILGFLSFVKIRHFIFFWFGTIVRKYFAKFLSITDKYYVISAIGCIFIAMILFPSVFHITGLEYPAFMISGFASAILLFTFFRKNERLFTKDKWFGRSLQFIGKRTLDIYLIHYFFLPYHCLQDFGAWLIEYDSKALEIVVILLLSLCVLAVSLLASSIIRLSPFLAHYLFGAKTKKYDTKFG